MSRRRSCCCTGGSGPPPDIMPARSACNIAFPSTFLARSYTFSVSGSIQSLVYGINVPPICSAGTDFLAHTDCTPYAQQIDYLTYPDCNPEDPQCKTNSKAVSTSSFSGTATIAGGTSGGLCNSQAYFSSYSSGTLCSGSDIADSFTPLFAVQCDQEYQSDCSNNGTCYNTSTIAIQIGAGGEVTYIVKGPYECEETSVTTCLLTAMTCIYQRRKATTDTWMAEGIYYLVKVQNREQTVGSCPDIPDLCGSVTSPVTRAGVPSTITVTGF